MVPGIRSDESNGLQGQTAVIQWITQEIIKKATCPDMQGTEPDKQYDDRLPCEQHFCSLRFVLPF